MSEAAELRQAAANGIDVLSGHKPNGSLAETYDVEGVLLARPFKITKIGPVNLFVDDVDAAERFYVERLGFRRSEEAIYRGARCVFLRCGAEHHTLGLFPKELRRTLGLSERSSCLSFGIELGSYAQLREAVAFLKSRGVEIIDAIPPELYPGIDYSAFALDPDGHCIQLYYYMEQIGWDGRTVRPASERRKATLSVARGAGAACRHLSGPGVPGPVGLAELPFPAKAAIGTGDEHHSHAAYVGDGNVRGWRLPMRRGRTSDRCSRALGLA